MATRKHFAHEISKRAKQIGWPVEGMDSGYRISCPDGHRVQVHLTPSDINHSLKVMGELNRHGFEEAERDFKLLSESDRKAKLSEHHERAQAELDKAQRNADALARASGQNRIDEAVLLNPYPVPKTFERVLVTPELALKILDLNTENRPVRYREVELWKNVIESGKYRYTHQGVAIDSNGVLQDGQHRLSAVVATEVSVEMQISIGMPPENYDAIDTGLRRTFGDVVARHGFGNRNRVGTATRLIALYEDYPNRPWGAKVNNAEIGQLISTIDPKSGQQVGSIIHEATMTAQLLWAAFRINSGAAAVVVYELWKQVGREHPKVQEFLEGLKVGNIEDTEDARFALRRYMLSPTRRSDAVYHIGMMLKSWNKFVRGEKVKALSFRKGEDMPRVLYPED